VLHGKGLEVNNDNLMVNLSNLYSTSFGTFGLWIFIVGAIVVLREKGLSIADAAIEAARIRLRPILMTSLTFILGVMPLAVATGAGAGARNSVGTTVVGGMVASTVLSVLFIPLLYVVIRSLAPGRKAPEEGDRVEGANHVEG
jgi:Cu/Ag efflux pump CusA